MKRIFMMVLANVLMILTSSAQTNTIQNPILPGFNPDLSICRGGEKSKAQAAFDYYDYKNLPETE